MVKNISIFCGAHEGTNPNYALEAKKITALLSKKGVDVVFGGGNVGIMKIISDEAKDNNSKVTGITMESLHNLELTNPRIDDLVVTQIFKDSSLNVQTGKFGEIMNITLTNKGPITFNFRT